MRLEFRNHGEINCAHQTEGDIFALPRPPIRGRKQSQDRSVLETSGVFERLLHGMEWHGMAESYRPDVLGDPDPTSDASLSIFRRPMKHPCHAE